MAVSRRSTRSLAKAASAAIQVGHDSTAPDHDGSIAVSKEAAFEATVGPAMNAIKLGDEVSIRAASANRCWARATDSSFRNDRFGREARSGTLSPCGRGWR